jgi:two-component system response regulator AtoC
LRTAIEHGVVLAHGPKVTLRDLPGGIRQRTGTAAFSTSETVNPLDLAETEKRLITQALAATKGNITAAAKQLGISRRTLHRKLNELNAEKRERDAAKSKQ